MAEPTTDATDATDTGPLYRYTVEGADGYKYTLETPDDINEEEVLKRIDLVRGNNPEMERLEQSAEGIAARGGVQGGPLGGANASISDAANTSYADILKRRYGENLEAFRGLGVNQYQMVFGGNPEGRMKSAVDYARGIGAPVSAALTPLSGAVEKFGLAVGADPDIARNIGDLSELPAGWLFGAIAASGKLGMPALKLAQYFGAGRPTQLAHQRLHDPHLDYAADMSDMSLHEKMIHGISPVEELSRMSGQSIGDLAIAAKKPTIASVRLKQVKTEGDVWDAKIGNGDYSSAHDIPESPTYVYRGHKRYEPRTSVTPGDKADNQKLKKFFGMNEAAEAEFTPPNRDPIFVLGTTSNAARKASPYAEDAAYQLELGEMRLIEAKKVHHERNVAGIVGYGDETARNAVAYRNWRRQQPSNVTRNVDAETSIDQPTKDLVKWLDDKILVSNAIWRPRLRASIRERIERQVRAEFGRGNKAYEKDWIRDNEKAISKEVHKRVREEVPDDWSIEDHIADILQGDYSISAKNGMSWSATTPQGLRQVVREIKEFHPEIDLKDLSITGKRVYLDDDLIRELNGGRTHKIVDNLLADIGTKTNLEDIWNGVKPKGKTNYFKGLLENKKAKSVNYGTDLIRTLDILDGQMERLLMLSDVGRKVEPAIRELRSRGLSQMAATLERTFDSLKGVRPGSSIAFDRFIASNPLLAKHVAPYALDRLAGGLKSLLVTGYLKVNPRYQAQNAVQLAQTLYPIVDGIDMVRGARLAASKEGRDILQRHGVFGVQNKVEGQTLFGSPTAGKMRQWYEKGTTATEKFNQEKAFLVMYDKARRLGLNDMQAAAYGKLRGQVYSQFLGLTSDIPDFFRRADPYGVLSMFQRYPVKQFQMLMDIVKDKNFPAAAKWLAVNFMLGGARASAMGNAGWLTHKAYEDVKRRYGETIAQIFHSGLPSLLGIDMSASVMFLNPPFGDNMYEKIGRLATGVIGSLTGSVIGAAVAEKQPEPEAARRAFNALVQNVPAFRQLEGVIKLMYGDYDLRTPGGKLKYRADAKDLFKRILGAKPGREAIEDTAIQAFMEVKERRDHLLSWVAARRGQDIGLGQDMDREVQRHLDAWNGMWPEFPINEPEIRTRGKMIKESTTEDTMSRLMRHQPKALQRHPAFENFRLNRIPGGEGGGG